MFINIRNCVMMFECMCVCESVVGKENLLTSWILKLCRTVFLRTVVVSKVSSTSISAIFFFTAALEKFPKKLIGIFFILCNFQFFFFLSLPLFSDCQIIFVQSTSTRYWSFRNINLVIIFFFAVFILCIQFSTFDFTRNYNFALQPLKFYFIFFFLAAVELELLLRICSMIE